jgi:Bacterial Ig domain/SdrD B-like domain/Dockerin type I domain
MKKQITRMFQKLSRVNKGRKQQSLRRQLRMEGLEGRRVMAGDTGLHNTIMAEDVNHDFSVTPLDAMLVISHINRVRSGAGAGEGETGGKFFTDVSDDGVISPLDVLLVIDALRGEGEDTPIVEYSVKYFDTATGLEITQVAVGQTFTARIFVKDLRLLPELLDLPDFDNPPVGNFPSSNQEIPDVDRNGNGVFDPGPDDTFAAGVSGAGVDLDLSGSEPASNLVQHVVRTNFLSGITSGPRLNAFPAGVRGAIVAFSAANGSGITEGTTVRVEDRTGVVRVFEFDSDSSIIAGNIAVPYTSASTRAQLAQALSGAINSAQGFLAKAVLDVNTNRISFTGAASSLAGLATVTGTGLFIDPEFNEMALADVSTEGLLLDRFPSVDPTRLETFFSANFVALKAGVFTITPNPSEDASNAPTFINFYTSESVSVPDPQRNILPGQFLKYAAKSITILADPSAPTPVADTVSTNEDTAIILAGPGSTLSPAITANDIVTAPRTLTPTISVIAGTTKGTLSGSTYTPPANFNGQDFLTYTVVDSTGLASATSATITINVNPVNDPPVGVADAFNVTGDSTDNTLNVLANDSRGPENELSQPFTIASVSTPNNGGTVTRVNGNTSLLYTPAAGFDGTETFTYRATDGIDTTTDITVTITVDPATRPLARRDTASLAEVSAGGSGSVTINVLSNDAVNTGVDVKALLESFTQPANGVVTRNENGTPADTSDDQLVYVPNFEFNGTDTFTYVMKDTSVGSNTSTGTVVVTVTDINDPPILTDKSLATPVGTENSPLTIPITAILGNDSPGAGETTTQTLSITSISSASGTGVVSVPNVVFTPSTSLNGPLTFVYTATDNGVVPGPLSGTATITVSFTAVNDAPIANADQRATNEDRALVITAASLATNDAPGPATATDEASQTLTVLSVSPTGSAGGTVGLSGGNVTYTPLPNFNGTETYTYVVQDSGGATATGTVTMTVNPVNDAPTAGPDMASGFKGVAIQIPVATLLANDTVGPANESAQTLSITAVFNAQNGTVSLNNSTGIITFMPNSDFTGSASFQYTVQDSGPAGDPNANSATGTVSVNIQPFVPTDVSGTVWVDETNDGIIDAAERRLGGVKVTLTGVALGVAISPQTIKTLADGSYSFDDLAPGRYVVSYDKPAYMMDGKDTAGPAGDADTLNNQFTVEIAQPGGIDGSGYNFGVVGIEYGYGRALDLLASRYMQGNLAAAHNGAYVAIGADNSLLWFSQLDGFNGILYGEAVLNSNGTNLQFTIVDGSSRIYTASLNANQFVVTADAASGNRIIRILGARSSINFQEVNFFAPPVVNANRYFDAIDEIFAQEGWNSV